MGNGPDGSGVTIEPAGANTTGSRESFDERRLRERRERAERMRLHRERQDAYRTEHGLPLGKQTGDRVVLGKQDAGPPEDKMLRPTGVEDKVDVDSLSKDQLKALAAKRAVDVVRADGRTDLEPTVADYRRALG